MVSFCKKEKGQPLVVLESWYANTKAWSTRFFFINGVGWDFPKAEEVVEDFPVRAI